MLHESRRRGTRIGCWWESQREGGHWEDQDVEWVDNIRIDLVEVGCGDVVWLRIGTGGELL
jgi:hypothetical protein